MRPHSSREVLVGAEPAEVALEWVERARDLVEQAKRTQHSEEVLDADATFTALEALNGRARNIGAFSHLRLRQPSELSPRGYVFGNLPLGPRDRAGGSGLKFRHDITSIIALYARYVELLDPELKR